MEWNLSKRTIFLTLTGSHAYGLNTPESDVDYRGVAIPPLDYFFGLKKFEQAEGHVDGFDVTAEDTVIYDIRKALNLIADANPNMLELLFVNERSVVATTPYWEMIKENRSLFVSKKVRFTYSGYAMAQLNRIKSHKAWLMNPLEKKPTRAEYGIPENENLVSKDHIPAILSMPEEYVRDEIREFARNYKAYHSALTNWEHYQTWKKERNPKRAAIEAAFGYDTKHASHLVRLMRQGKEILETGNVIVDRTGIDADELRAIKQGSWKYDDLLAYCENMDSELNALYEKSTLPHHPDKEKINNLLVNVVSLYLEENKNVVSLYMEENK
jgi:hypothetical protein